MATQQNNGLGFIAALITGAVSLTSTIVSAVSKRKERKAAEKMQQAQLEYEQQLQEQQEAEAAAAARQAKIAAQEQRAAERKARIAAELPVLKANYEQQKAKTKRNWIIAGIATATFLVVLATDNKKKR